MQASSKSYYYQLNVMPAFFFLLHFCALKHFFSIRLIYSCYSYLLSENCIAVQIFSDNVLKSDWKRSKNSLVLSFYLFFSSCLSFCSQGAPGEPGLSIIGPRGPPVSVFISLHLINPLLLWLLAFVTIFFFFWGPRITDANRLFSSFAKTK